MNLPANKLVSIVASVKASAFCAHEREWHKWTLDMESGTFARLPDQSVGVEGAAQKTKHAHKSQLLRSAVDAGLAKKKKCVTAVQALIASAFGIS